MATSTDQPTDRVQEATPDSINAAIEKKMWDRVASYMHRNPGEIDERISELDKEWDIERYLGVNMSTVAMSGLATAVFSKNKQWLVLPAIVLGFFFQHSVQGWCPPLPLLRKLNIRTAKEIEQEKYALKFIRGDFNHLQNIPALEVENLLQAIKKT